jgi:tetratricopeptide (TPR) repeat protein
VFGQRFWLGAVKELLGGDGLARDFESVMRELVDEEVLQERPISRFPGEREFTFRSGLVRDAAYAALTDDDKQRSHHSAADWLESSGESEAFLLATHFARGGKSERAVGYYTRAADQALSGNDLDAAIERAALGLGAGPSPREGARLRLIQAEASKWLGNNAAARKYAVSALELATRGSGEWCTAAAEAAVAAGKLGERNECIHHAHELLECAMQDDNERELGVALSRVATQLVLVGCIELAKDLLDRVTRMSDELYPNPGVLAWLCEAQAVLAGATDDPVGRIELAESAALRFEEAGDLRNACLQRVSLGFAQVEFGAHREAERSLREALDVAQRLALSNSIPLAQAHLARALGLSGRAAEGIELENAAVATFDRQGNLRLAGISRVYLARLHQAAGDLVTAEAEARRAVGILVSAPPLRRSALAALALILVQRGEHAEAVSLAEQAAQGLEVDVQLPVGESLVRLALIEAYLAVGRETEGHAALALAKSRLLRLAEAIESPRRRRQFLDSSPERSRILELAGSMNAP